MKRRLEVLSLLGDKVLGEYFLETPLSLASFLNMVNLPKDVPLQNMVERATDEGLSEKEVHVLEVLQVVGSHRVFLEALKPALKPFEVLFSEEELNLLVTEVSGGGEVTRKEVLQSFNTDFMARLKFYIGLVRVLAIDCLPMTPNEGNFISDVRNTDYYGGEDLKKGTRYYVTTTPLPTTNNKQKSYPSLLKGTRMCYVAKEHTLKEYKAYKVMAVHLSLKKQTPSSELVRRMLEGEIVGLEFHEVKEGEYADIGFGIETRVKDLGKIPYHLVGAYISNQDLTEWDREEVLRHISDNLNQHIDPEGFLARCEALSLKKTESLMATDKDLLSDNSKTFSVTSKLYLKKIETVEGGIDPLPTYNKYNLYLL